MKIICECGNEFLGEEGKEDTCPDCLKKLINPENKKIELGKCPYKNKDFLIEEHINKNKNGLEISREFKIPKSTINYWLNKFKISRGRKKINLREKNGMWKGDKVGYCALHNWIEYNKSKPEFCEECKKNKHYDLANISGKYKRDINDFEWLCRSCHMKKDYKFGVRKPTRVKK